MRNRVTLALIAMAALVTGPASADLTPVAPRKVTLTGQGLTVYVPGKVPQRAIPFGTARIRVIAYLKTALGAPTRQGHQNECGEGPMDYINFPGKLSVTFQDTHFAGWTLGNGGDTKIATAKGVTLGMTRKVLKGVYPATTVEASSLGTEFLSLGISGLFDGTGQSARITDMWAGSTCIAR